MLSQSTPHGEGVERSQENENIFQAPNRWGHLMRSDTEFLKPQTGGAHRIFMKIRWGPPLWPAPNRWAPNRWAPPLGRRDLPVTSLDLPVWGRPPQTGGLQKSHFLAFAKTHE